MNKEITMVFENILMLECVACGFRLRLPLAQHDQIKHMFCANCDSDGTFTEAPWTVEEQNEGV